MITEVYIAMVVAGIGLQVMLSALGDIAGENGVIPKAGVLDPKAQLFVTALFLAVFVGVTGLHALMLNGAYKAFVAIPLAYLAYYLVDYRGIARIATAQGRFVAGVYCYLASWAYGLVWLITVYLPIKG